MQKVRSHPLKRLLLFVCMRFQDLFHSPPGVLFAFPSQYWFTIGLLVVFSLTGWSRQIQTGFLVSRPTQDTAFFTSITRTQLSCSSAGFSKTVPVLLVSNPAVLQPRHCRNNVGLGFFPFARRYSGNRCFFLFLWFLEKNGILKG